MYGLPVRPDAAPAERTNDFLSCSLIPGERQWYNCRIYEHQPRERRRDRVRGKYPKHLHVSDGHDCSRRQLYTRSTSTIRVTDDDEFTTSKPMLFSCLADFKGHSRKVSRQCRR